MKTSKYMSSSFLTILMLFILILTPGCQPAEGERERWTVEQANKWLSENGWLRGSNFIPSTAVNQLEMWQEESFDIATINRELGYAESLGFNFMRVYLHHKAWLQDPEGFKSRLDTYLEAASGHGIKTMFVFFDDCWNGTSRTGKQPDPKPGIHNSGWVQDPGQTESADTGYFPLLERYVKDVMESFAYDDRIILWDLYNEPGGSGKGEGSLILLRQVFSWARSTNAVQPVTAGIWTDRNKKLNEYQLNNSDIITFHNYGRDSSMIATIDSLRKFNRPLVCSEYMARTNGSRFENILPILKNENVGAVNWGLVSGKTNTMYAWSDTSHTDGSEPEMWFHDIFRPDGTPYKEYEVNLIRSYCTE